MVLQSSGFHMYIDLPKVDPPQKKNAHPTPLKLLQGFVKCKHETIEIGGTNK